VESYTSYTTKEDGMRMESEKNISPSISSALHGEVAEMFRKKRVRAWMEHKCVDCGKEVPEDSFHDALSEKEYTLSALCQKCQDRIFGPCDGP